MNREDEIERSIDPFLTGGSRRARLAALAADSITTGGGETTIHVSMDALMEFAKRFRADQERMENGLCAALRVLLPGEAGEELSYKIVGLAQQMNVSPFDIKDYLYEGKRPISASFWEATREWIEKMSRR